MLTDLAIFVIGFSLGMFSLHYIRAAFYSEKMKLLHSVQSELHVLYAKLNGVADKLINKG